MGWDMAKQARKERWASFWMGVILGALVFVVPCAVIVLRVQAAFSVMQEAVQTQRQTEALLRTTLDRCKGTSAHNADIAVDCLKKLGQARIHEDEVIVENVQLRQLIEKYQAQLRQGQIPAELAKLLLGLFL